jgi:hypothetical protein
VASGIYNVFKGNLMKKEVNLHTAGDTIKVALYGSDHAFSAADTAYTTTNELTTAGGSNYAVGGETLGAQAVTVVATTKWDGNDVPWTGASFTAYHAVIYDDTNTSSLICSIDFGGAKTVSAGTFTIAWNAAGIITLASA